MKKFLLYTFIFCSISANSQSVLVSEGSDVFRIVDRLEIKSGSFAKNIFTNFKSYNRKDVAQFADSFNTINSNLSTVDYFNLSYLQTDNTAYTNSEESRSKISFIGLYRKKNALYSHQEKDFDIYINPVLNFGFAKEVWTSLNLTKKNNLYTNTRGAEIYGNINKKVSYYTYITENQEWVPDYVNSSYTMNSKPVPGGGFIKTFKTGKNSYDYFIAKGYLTFSPVKNIMVQFGQDRNFIGNGMRSFILSDFATPYFFLKLHTKVWKFNYTNLFTKLTDYKDSNNKETTQPKYMALHHLSYNICKNFNVGIFESVVFGNKDANGTNRALSIEYYNPVIFYRAVEQNNNSIDNSVIGMDFKYNFLHHFSLYGQFVFDEFLLNHLKAQDGYWANKYAIQSGLKYIDVATIKNLDLQIEYNLARPYIYSHYTSSTAYSQYGQPLAHPSGANFKELLGNLHYQPFKKIHINLRGMYLITGLDSGKTDWGTNIYTSYHNRMRIGAPDNDLHHFIGQGIATQIIYSEASLTYMPKHNFFFDLKIIYRKQTSMVVAMSHTDIIPMISIRMNIAQRNFMF